MKKVRKYIHILFHFPGIILSVLLGVALGFLVWVLEDDFDEDLAKTIGEFGREFRTFFSIVGWCIIARMVHIGF